MFSAFPFLFRDLRFLFACAVLLWQLPRLAAQDSFTLTREWHRQDGLPSEVISLLAQDPQGYLWLSTQFGLVRFDGQTFETSSFPEAQKGSQTQSLIATPDGLWIVQCQGPSLLLGSGAPRSLPLPAAFVERTVIGAFAQPDGTRWMAFQDGSLLRFKNDHYDSPDGSEVLSSSQFAFFASDAYDRLWLSDGQKLGRFDGSKFTAVDLGTGESELRLASSRSGGPWIFTKHALLKLDSNDRPHTVCLLPPLLGAHYITTAREDRTGALWLGTRSQGLHRMANGTLSSIPTASESIRAIHEDSQGNLWVGTNAGGLSLVGPQLHRLYDKSAGLIENAAYALTEGPDGTIWCANGDGGTVGIRNGRIRIAPRMIPSDTFMVTSVASSPSSGILLGGALGLFRLDTKLSAPPVRISDSSITLSTRLFTDSQGQVWFAAGKGKIGCLGQDGSIRILSTAQGFSEAEVRCFAEDGTRTVWLGTSRGELFRIEDRRLIQVPIPGVLRSTEAINAIHFDGDGSLWLACSGSGIALLRDGRSWFLNTLTGLPDNVITQLIADELGNVWCGSSTGIFRLSRSEVRGFIDGELKAVTPLKLGRDQGLGNLACSSTYFPRDPPSSRWHSLVCHPPWRAKHQPTSQRSQCPASPCFR